MSKNIQLLFSGQMADANVKGWKEETRRMRGFDEVNKQPDDYRFLWFNYERGGMYAVFDQRGQGEPYTTIKCPYGNVGDMICQREQLKFDDGWRYAADNALVNNKPYEWIAIQANRAKKSIPAIHMPSWACRFQRVIKEISVERLQSITPDGAFAEGIRFSEDVLLSANWNAKYVPAYRDLWIEINGAESWERNPWVCVIKY